jgi:Plavaka transposase
MLDDTTIQRIFRSPKNTFSLYRQYKAKTLPQHDPEEAVDIDDLSNIPRNQPHQVQLTNLSQESYHPYPNYNSFRLGDWYWNHGTQKSQANFRELIDIVGDTSFQSSDVRHTRWDSINNELASDNPDVWEWLDEGACWTQTSVEISVPFHRKTKCPGLQTYTISDFYHRNIVSVIRERLTNNFHFHFDPYELYWQVGESHPPIRVHGEIYTSASFVEAHQELQDSPGEPGCDLPRVVIALMFSSDSTHLTSFGDVKLWPLYLFMGNESKYRRCKPSRNLCSHIAYFRKVTLVKQCTRDDKRLIIYFSASRCL